MGTDTILGDGGKMVTGIESINRRAISNSQEKFNALMHHFSEENLRECFEGLDGKKAVGTDGISKAEYGLNLGENLRRLVESLKEMSYRPKPVKQVEIQKEDGSLRKLGISSTEDKIIQDMTRRVLEAIYEPVFMETSYGFRPGRDCHDALRKLDNELMTKPVNWIVDMDISKFFDTIPHDQILNVLSERISDKRFLRLITRQLKSGISLSSKGHEEVGTVQGSIVSPVIGNIYLDKVLDKWFEGVLKGYFRGYCELIRYADDAIALFQNEEDAVKFMKVLPLRLAKYGLKLNVTKTEIIRFGKTHKEKQESFDFLGFTHYWGKSKSGKTRLKRKTSKKRLKRSIVITEHWIKQNRNMLPLKELWELTCSKLRGHYNYYGISDNGPSLVKYLYEVKKRLFKWLNKRSQRSSFTWEGFDKYLQRHPLPKPKIRISMFMLSAKN